MEDVRGTRVNREGRKRTTETERNIGSNPIGAKK